LVRVLGKEEEQTHRRPALVPQALDILKVLVEEVIGSPLVDPALQDAFTVQSRCVPVKVILAGFAAVFVSGQKLGL
jgi:hypothetical protein